MSEISSQDEKEIFAKYMLEGYKATRKYIIKNFYKENTEFIENTISDKIQFTKSVLDKIFNKPEKLNDFLNSPSTPKREYILNEDGKLNLERTSNDTQTKNEFTKQIFGAYTHLNKRIDEEYISDFDPVEMSQLDKDLPLHTGAQKYFTEINLVTRKNKYKYDLSYYADKVKDYYWKYPEFSLA